MYIAGNSIDDSTNITNAMTENTDVFRDLDDNSKRLVEQISGMGFPKQRVIRIVQLVGADDKKVCN